MELGMQTQRFCVNGPMVVSETIDNESIILHHGTGHYFSTRDSGAIIWSGIEAGLSFGALCLRLQEACSIEALNAERAVTAFIQELREKDLVRDGDESVKRGQALELIRSVPFSAPNLEQHDDLADMLLLDPIHDVTDDGWPTAKATA
jgi:hypothetical protein